MKRKLFSLSTVTSSFVMIGMFGGVFLTPIYLQNIQGRSFRCDWNPHFSRDYL